MQHAVMLKQVVPRDNTENLCSSYVMEGPAQVYFVQVGDEGTYGHLCGYIKGSPVEIKIQRTET
jgi:hypothetical protein